MTEGEGEEAAAAAEDADTDADFAEWARVELMGHRVLYGRVTEAALFGTKLLRIDVPSEPPSTQFYGGGAIYCVTPVTEAAVRAALGLDRPPISRLPAPGTFEVLGEFED